MSAPRKRKAVVEDALASPVQPGTVSEDSSDERRRQTQRRRNVANANRPGMAINRELALWQAVNRETQLEALNRETASRVSEWNTFDPSSSSNDGDRGGHSLDVAEYLRASKEIENRFGGPSGDIVTYGNNESSQLGIPELLNEKIKFAYPPRRVNGVTSPARHIVCGGMHNVVLLENGHVMTWGCSDGGP
jgi:Regulator of chromosome condensation (RCC1) repeat